MKFLEVEDDEGFRGWAIRKRSIARDESPIHSFSICFISIFPSINQSIY